MPKPEDLLILSRWESISFFDRKVQDLIKLKGLNRQACFSR